MSRRRRRALLLVALWGLAVVPALAPRLPHPAIRHGIYQDGACIGPLCLIASPFFELSWGEY